MLKQGIYTLLIFSLFTLFSCDKIATISVGRDLIVALDVNSLAAGQTFTKAIDLPTADIKQALQEKGGSKVQIEELMLQKVVLTIPDTASWTFADIESVNVLLEGKNVGTLPLAASGKTLTLNMDANQESLKSTFLSTSSFKVNFSIKAKKATTATKLMLAFTFNIDAALLL